MLSIRERHQSIKTEGAKRSLGVTNITSVGFEPGRLEEAAETGFTHVAQAGNRDSRVPWKLEGNNFMVSSGINFLNQGVDLFGESFGVFLATTVFRSFASSFRRSRSRMTKSEMAGNAFNSGMFVHLRESCSADPAGPDALLSRNFLDSPVKALLFPPLSPPVQLQLGLLHQRLTRHDTQSGGPCVISCRPRQHQLLALGDTWDVVPFASIQPSWRRRTIHFKRDGRRDGAALGRKHCAMWGSKRAQGRAGAGAEIGPEERERV